jgi:hypothetical protein
MITDHDQVMSRVLVHASMNLVQTTAAIGKSDDSVEDGNRRRRYRRNRRHCRRQQSAFYQQHYARRNPRLRVATLADVVLEIVGDVMVLLSQACVRTYSSPNSTSKRSSNSCSWTESEGGSSSSSDAEGIEIKDAVERVVVVRNKVESTIFETTM